MEFDGLYWIILDCQEKNLTPIKILVISYTMTTSPCIESQTVQFSELQPKKSAAQKRKQLPTKLRASGTPLDGEFESVNSGLKDRTRSFCSQITDWDVSRSFARTNGLAVSQLNAYTNSIRSVKVAILQMSFGPI